MKNKLIDLCIGVLVLGAVAVAGLVVRHELVPPQRGFTRPEPRRVDNWELLTRGAAFLGSPDAPVKIVVFSDFQCPFCAGAARSLVRLVDGSSGAVAVAFRHLPYTPTHPYAFDAALAASCANEQGQFREYHDLLFARQTEIGSKPWEHFAREAGVQDTHVFRACLDDQRTRDRVADEVHRAKQIGVRVTPTFIINGMLIEGTMNYSELEARVARN